MDVGKRITILKEHRGLSTNKLASLAGIAQSALRSIELGEKSPTIDTLDLILKALDVTPVDFFAMNINQEIKKQEAEKLLPLALNHLKEIDMTDLEKEAYKIFLEMNDDKKINELASVVKNYNSLPETQREALKIIISSLCSANYLQ